MIPRLDCLGLIEGVKRLLAGTAIGVWLIPRLDCLGLIEGASGMRRSRGLIAPHGRNNLNRPFYGIDSEA